jgi:hypothetical protein
LICCCFALLLRDDVAAGAQQHLKTQMHFYRVQYNGKNSSQAAVHALSNSPTCGSMVAAAGAQQHLKTQKLSHRAKQQQQQAWQASPPAAAALQPALLLLLLRCRSRRAVWLLLQHLRCKCCRKLRPGCRQCQLLLLPHCQVR